MLMLVGVARMIVVVIVAYASVVVVAHGIQCNNVAIHYRDANGSWPVENHVQPERLSQSNAFAASPHVEVRSQAIWGLRRCAARFSRGGIDTARFR